MRNEKKSKISTILAPARRLPLFSMRNLAVSEKDHSYLKTLLSRYVKRGEIIRLKKGWYVTLEFLNTLERRGAMADYLEWVGIKLHEPSYLSLDYVLAKNNAITEMPQAVTAISAKKPQAFRNTIGVFAYRHVKADFFDGYLIVKKNGFYIPTATLAKALFDWLYLRQHALVDAAAIKELRLNGSVFKTKDWRELRALCARDATKRMSKIFNLVYAEYHA